MEERGQAEPWTPPQRCKVKWSRVGPGQWWGPLGMLWAMSSSCAVSSNSAMSSSHDMSFNCHCLLFILWSPLMKPFIAILGVWAAFSLGPSCGVQGLVAPHSSLHSQPQPGPQLGLLYTTSLITVGLSAWCLEVPGTAGPSWHRLLSGVPRASPQALAYSIAVKSLKLKTDFSLAALG